MVELTLGKFLIMECIVIWGPLSSPLSLSNGECKSLLGNPADLQKIVSSNNKNTVCHSAVLTKANSSQKGKDLKQRKSQIRDQRVTAVKVIVITSNTIQYSPSPFFTSSKWAYSPCHHNPTQKSLFAIAIASISVARWD